jgi:hypothetical protein
MQLIVPAMLKSVTFAALVAKGYALWHCAQSTGHCFCLASASRVSNKGRALKLIVFPEWDNLVHYGTSVKIADRAVVSIN